MQPFFARFGSHGAFALALMFLLAACAAGPKVAPAELGQTRGTSVGDVLTDPNGMTLYTYDPDTQGTSNCTGVCAVAWPPLYAPADAAPQDGFTAITRPDGSRQWAYEGNPLYLYVGDSKPGDVRGEGVDGVWHTARP